MSTSDHKMHAEHIKKSHLVSKNLEDCEPGATQAKVLEALEKVAKSPKHIEPPAPTS